MFDFVENPVICSREFPMLEKRPSPVLLQQGLQPVCLVQGDISMEEHPQSLSQQYFRKRR